MPRGDPFTALCQLAARLSRPVVADLHLHTTASDGEYTPSQVVAFAKRAQLDAIAITDHDTFAGVGAAVEAAATLGYGAPRVIPGVELTAEWDGREVHVLGLMIEALTPQPPLPRKPSSARTGGEGEKDDSLSSSPSPPPSLRGVWERGPGGEGFFFSRLTEMCSRRRERFRDFVRHIRDAGHPLDDGLVAAVEAGAVSLGRRHVASLLVRTGIAKNRREAWGRFVGPLGARVVPKLRLPFAEATALVREAGGLSSLAHPSPDVSESDLAAMRDAGLSAVEAKFPAAGVGRTTTLKTWAAALGLTVTGGSDCHGGEREVGSHGLNAGEWGQVIAATVEPGLGEPRAGARG